MSITDHGKAKANYNLQYIDQVNYCTYVRTTRQCFCHCWCIYNYFTSLSNTSLVNSSHSDNVVSDDDIVTSYPTGPHTGSLITESHKTVKCVKHT